MKYIPPYGSSDPNAPYVNGNPATGTKGSTAPAGMMEYPQREVINAILAANLTPSNDDMTQLAQAIALLGKIPYCPDLGSINHIVIDPIPILQSYQTPLIYAVRAAFTNTGPTDVNVSGIGTVSVTRTTGVALAPNDITGAGIILLGYDGSKFQLLSVPGSLAYPNPDSLWHYGHDL